MNYVLVYPTGNKYIEYVYIYIVLNDVLHGVYLLLASAYSDTLQQGD